MSATMPRMLIEVQEGDDWIVYNEVSVSQRSFRLPLSVAPLVERDVLGWLVSHARKVWLVRGVAAAGAWGDTPTSGTRPCVQIEVQEGDDWIEYSEISISGRFFCLPLTVARIVEKDVLAWLVNNVREVWLAKGTTLEHDS